MSTYTVRVSREGKWWMIYVPDIDALTQARHMGEIEPMAKDLISAVTETAENSFEVRIELEAVEDVRDTERIAQLDSPEEEKRAAAESFRRRQRRVARDCMRKGLSVSETAATLGVSDDVVRALLNDQET